MWGGVSGLALADDLEDAPQKHAQDVFDRAHEVAAEYNTESDTEVQLGHPVRATLRRADDYEAVVMWSHGGTIAERLFVGNVAQKIFRRSPVPVTVIR